MKNNNQQQTITTKFKFDKDNNVELINFCIGQEDVYETACLLNNQNNKEIFEKINSLLKSFSVDVDNVNFESLKY